MIICDTILFYGSHVMEKIASSEAPHNTSQPGTMQALTLSEHFNELRKRLLIIVIGLVVGVLVSFAFCRACYPIFGGAYRQLAELAIHWK